MNQKEMIERALEFVKRVPDQHGQIAMKPEEAQALAQMIIEIYYAVKDLKSAELRREHEIASGILPKMPVGPFGNYYTCP